MEFSTKDFSELDRIERKLREMAKHYGYREFNDVVLSYMRFMREVRVPHTSTWPTPPNGGNAA